MNPEYFSDDYIEFCANISQVYEPHAYKEASKKQEWIKAMNTELRALESNKTWSICDFPRGKKAVGNKWVFKVKFQPNGTLERYKARLVAKGYNQAEGEDYTDSFSPVAKAVTVRMLLAIAIARRWDIQQMDVKNAFLHGTLTGDVYMTLPEGYQIGKEGKVCKLHKAIYGLQHASRELNTKFSQAFKTIGFIQSHNDYCLFTKKEGNDLTYVLIC